MEIVTANIIPIQVQTARIKQKGGQNKTEKKRSKQITNQNTQEQE